jgi:hypothetical protein
MIVAFAPVRVVSTGAGLRFAPPSAGLGSFLDAELEPLWCPFGHLAPSPGCRCGHRVFPTAAEAVDFARGLGDPSSGWAGHRFVAEVHASGVVGDRCAQATVVRLFRPSRCSCFAPAVSVGWCTTGDAVICADDTAGFVTVAAACQDHCDATAARALTRFRPTGARIVA